MLLNSAADKLVFKFLNKIKNGYLEITTYEGEILKFGNPDQSLKANIKIKNTITINNDDIDSSILNMC